MPKITTVPLLPPYVNLQMKMPQHYINFTYFTYFITSLCGNAHIYTHKNKHTNIHTYICIHTLTYTDTITHCNLIIFSYDKSSQEYLDILLNYKKLEIYCYKKKNKNKKESK